MAKEVAYKDETVVRPAPLVSMGGGELVQSILVGLGVGLVVAVIMFLLNKFVFGAVLCRPQSIAECASAPTYAMIVAMVIGAIAGIVSLARLRIYRPLLAVLAATIALWGINNLVVNLPWYWALLAIMVLFGLAYGLFAWLARLRNFILAIVVTVVMVVIVRLILIA